MGSMQRLDVGEQRLDDGEHAEARCWGTEAR